MEGRAEEVRPFVSPSRITVLPLTRFLNPVPASVWVVVGSFKTKPTPTIGIRVTQSVAFCSGFECTERHTLTCVFRGQSSNCHYMVPDVGAYRRMTWVGKDELEIENSSIFRPSRKGWKFLGYRTLWYHVEKD